MCACLKRRWRPTLLLDLDLQFGSLAHSLDVLPTHSHTDVLQQIDTLDSVARYLVAHAGQLSINTLKLRLSAIAQLANC